MEIDISFDFRSDSGGKDPDKYSRTLRQYHKLLWSRDLPNGQFFGLTDSVPGKYLVHQSNFGEFFLSSDSVIPTFAKWKSMKPVTENFSADEIEAFVSIGYTMGGMMIFPANQVGGMQTINGARGFTRAISDRFDLTLECIRRHYLQIESPLSQTLARYADFFDLFLDFHGYVDFFLLQDLVNIDGEVQFFLPFDEFGPPSIPTDRHAYAEYRQRSIDFVRARNNRIMALGI